MKIMGIKARIVEQKTNGIAAAMSGNFPEPTVNAKENWHIPPHTHNSELKTRMITNLEVSFRWFSDTNLPPTSMTYREVPKMIEAALETTDN